MNGQNEPLNRDGHSRSIPDFTLGFACEWKRDRFQTWSHTPHSLFVALSSREDSKWEDLDISIPPIRRLFFQVTGARWSNGKLRSRFRFSESYISEISSVLLKSVKGRTLAAVLEMGDLGIIPDVPFYVFQDLSVDLMIKEVKATGRRYWQFEQFSLNDLLRRAEYQRRIYESCAGVFAMSHWLADSLVLDSGLPREKVHVVHAGVNVPPSLSRKNEPEREGPSILFVGRDFLRKGGDIVLAAFDIVRQSHPKATLMIAGPRSWPGKNGIPPGVMFLGNASWDALQKCYTQATVFCMPSRSEGFGIVFAEALCHGIPCIGRNEGVMREIIDHGKNGYLMEDESSRTLAEFIVKVHEDLEMRERVRTDSTTYRSYYSWNRVAEDIQQTMIRAI